VDRKHMLTHRSSTARQSVGPAGIQAIDIAGVRKQSWFLLVLLCVAQFMVIIDATVVNVALPSIGRELRFATAADLQWVVTAYVLVTGGLTLLGGRTTDLLDRRRLFLVGLFVFTAASLTTGLSPSPGVLIASRAAQGVGAALLTPAALAIITTAYVGPKRTAALAVWGALGAAGAAVGLVLGGVLTSWFGWQWVFFINVPIGAAAAAIGLLIVPAPPPSTGRLRDLDIAGALALISGLVLLVLAITAGTVRGWTSAQTALLFVLAIGLLAAFAAIERKVKQPIVPPSTWRVRSLISGNAMYLGASAIMGGSFFLSSLYVQRVLGAPAWEAGLSFLPLALMVGVAGRVGSALVSRAGVRPVVLLGLVLEGGGALLLAHAPADANYFANVLPGFLGIGFGLGLAFVAVPLLVMADVSEADTGMASGMMQTAHEIGISLGVAAISAIATAGGAEAGFEAGFRQGLLAAALIAGLLVATSFIAVPSVPLAPTPRVPSPSAIPDSAQI
jgi:EmrB/QacA subfamily drug resistance transporter